MSAPSSGLRLPRLIVACLLLAVVVVFAISPFVSNPFTPAGSVGYIYEEPRAFGDGGFKGLVEGPGSFGGSLKRHRAVNIDVRPANFAETTSISGDAGEVVVEWETQLHPDPKQIQAVVESFGASEWYQRHVGPLVLAQMRAVIADEPAHRYDAKALEEQTLLAIQAGITEQKMPFVLDGLSIRKLQVPKQLIASNRQAEDEAAAEKQPVANAETGTGEATTSEDPGDEATLIEVSHRREFRGMWLATISNVDWPSREGLDAERQKKELITYLDQLQEMNLNALIFQVRPACDTFYRSDLEPWAPWLTGTAGGDPGYDPLQFAIDECRKRSIELHAWFNPYRGMPVEDYEVPDNHIIKRMKEHAIPYASKVWMDPGVKEVRDHVIAVIVDVVKRYDIDGVHLDDYFYPYPSGNEELDDSKSYNRFVDEWGPIEKNEWRRRNIDGLISRLSEEIRETKPHVKFGVSPFGLYRPGEPHGTKGLDQTETICSDPKKWLENGWIDYLTPQLYWREKSNRSYSKLLEWWGETNYLRRHIYAGNNLISIERNKGNWPFSEFKTQLDASREAMELQSLGNIFFGLRVFRGKSGAKVLDRFAKSFYPDPALPPAMPWLSNRPPARAVNVNAGPSEIRWDAAASANIKHWTLYARDAEDGSWSLQEILPASTTRIDAAIGSYALCAVDRLMQESIGVAVEVVEVEPSADDAAKADEGEVADSDEDEDEEEKG